MLKFLKGIVKDDSCMCILMALCNHIWLIAVD